MRPAKTLLALLGVSTLVAQPRFDPSELHATSGPYAPRSQYTVKVDTNLVEIAVVVRDNRGRAVSGLQKTDFEIQDNGKKRDIRAFSVEHFTPASAKPVANSTAPRTGTQPASPPPRPRFVGLLFDDLNSNFDEFRQAQVAAARFVKEGLAAGDQVGVFSTYGQQLLPFTSDAPKILAAVEKMRIRNMSVDRGFCPQMTPYDAYLIANHLDQMALETKVEEVRRCNPSLQQPPARGGRRGAPAQPTFLSSDPAVQTVTSQASSTWQQVSAISRNTLDAIRGIVDFMASQDGSRMLLLASGGFLTGTLEREQDYVIAHALRAGVVINSLDAKGLYTQEFAEMPAGGGVRSVIYQQGLGTRPQETKNDALAYLAQSTGGLFFHNNNDLDQGFRELGMAPEVTYLLAISPETPDEKYHKLRVQLSSGARHNIQSRPGYFAAKQSESAPQPERKIDRELFQTTPIQDLPVTLAVTPIKNEAGAQLIQARLRVFVKQLSFLELAGLRTQKLNFIVALLDETGRFITGKEGALEFAMRQSTFDQFSLSGLSFTVDLDSPPQGAYRLRAVIEDNEGKTAAATLPLAVP